MRSPSLDLAAIAHADALVEELGPLVAPGRVRRLVPFLAVVLFAVAAMRLEHTVTPGVFALISTSALVLGVALLVAPWRRLPRWAQSGVVLVWPFVVDAAMRTDDGVNSPLLALMLVPLIWTALYEGRLLLILGLGQVTCLLGVQAVQRSAPASASLRVLVMLVMSVAILPALRTSVTINRAALRMVSEMAHLDPLTGLVNRRGLDRWLAQAAAQIPERAPAQGFGIVFVDLDRFKEINDTFGHDTGDRILVEVARRITSEVRSGDVVGRIGGDEFVIACDGGRSSVAALAERVQAAIRHASFLVAGQRLQLSASVGFSHLDHHPGNAEDLMREADASMYRAKAAQAAGPRQRHRSWNGRHIDA